AAVRGVAQLRDALDALAERSAEAARRALDAPTDRITAFDALAQIDYRGDDNGLVVLDADTALAWSGTVRVPLRGVREGTGIVATPFYLALTATARRGARHATAVALLDAAPPADRLSVPLARRIAVHSGLTGFTFVSPSDSAAGSELLHYARGAARLFDVRAAPLLQSNVAFRITERVRVPAGVAFLLALACFIIGVWRGTRGLPRRVAALAVGLACTALVPL